MGRKATLDEAELMNRISRVFRAVGYEGATLAALSAATGLQKASLYHRFPGGKEQMAREVLAYAGAWLGENVVAVLTGAGPPEERIRAMVRTLDEFYSGGRQACLLNMLSSARIHEGPFVEPIKAIFEAWIGALAAVLVDAGQDGDTARRRAERAVVMLQGSLVLSRGMGTTRPFMECLQSLPDDLLAAPAAARPAGDSH